MLNTFDQDTKAATRRAEREKQLELMNHAANGTGPFAAEAMDTNWDQALDIQDLDIDQNVQLGSVHPTDATGGGCGGNALDPERARAAALAALEAADRGHSETSRITKTPPAPGDGKARRPSSTGGRLGLLVGTRSASAVDVVKSEGPSSAPNNNRSASSRFLWKDASDDDDVLAEDYHDRKSSMYRTHKRNHNEFTIQDDDDDDDYANVHSRRNRSAGGGGGGGWGDGIWGCFTRQQYGRIGGRPITRRMVLIALACLAGFVVLISVIASAKKNTEPPASSSAVTNDGDNDNNAQTTTVVSGDDRYQAYIDAISSRGLTPVSTLSDPSTPQGKALQWLSYQDVDEYIDLESSSGIDMLLNKYGLVVLYYAAIVNDPIFDDPEAAVDEEGEVIERQYADKTYDVEENEGPSYTPHGLEWLSGYPDDGGYDGEAGNLPPYCHWSGVSCHRAEDAVQYGGEGLVREVNLTRRGLDGYIPSEVPQALNSMVLLDLGYNNLRGTIPATLGSATLLRQLYLGGNQLTGTIPPSIGNLGEVEDLYLHQNFLKGPIPSEIGQLTNLDGLGLYQNALTGTIPNTFANLANIYVLYLDDNELTGTIPRDMLLGLENVSDLRLRKNFLEGQIPDEIIGMGNLELLYLDENALTGYIPGTIMNLDQLTQVHLYKNRLTGPIPDEMSSLVNLELMYVDNNLLTGTIPPFLGALDGLEALYLFSNDLGGQIPAELGDLTNLRTLRMNDNNLSGPLPADLGNLWGLELLYVDDNALTGQLPVEIADLGALAQLRIENNFITGTVPPQVCRLVEDEVLLEFSADCGEPSPKLTCSCCMCTPGEEG